MYAQHFQKHIQVSKNDSNTSVMAISYCLDLFCDLDIVQLPVLLTTMPGNAVPLLSNRLRFPRYLKHNLFVLILSATSIYKSLTGMSCPSLSVHTYSYGVTELRANYTLLMIAMAEPSLLGIPLELQLKILKGCMVIGMAEIHNPWSNKIYCAFEKIPEASSQLFRVCK